ncbi:S1 family peptidase [Micromonospora sp. WMMD1155]|uniref:S1 family peptidase n=1 Tax=Micromonospora sp. WMMD1155 TaxID=3016094 RepID=UPI00249C4854|nr:S1 family peptidase [Micromonospora sp. WMMD1155]WFE54685.1 S1 family peptidase [Micromonospora sp. WMMD1155]
MTGRRSRTGGAAALIALGLAAGSLTGASAQAVGGGVAPADGSYDFVTKIDIGGVRACSGALIDLDWVVTAKQCLVDNGQALTAGAPTRPTTVTVGRSDLTGTGGHVVAVTRVEPHPDRDVALVELAAPVTDVAVPDLGAAPVAGELIRVGGYGRTATEWVPSRLHTASFIVDTVDAASIDIVGTSTGASICRGDAGGPAFRQVSDRIELVAINHAAWQGGCLGETETRTDATGVRLDDLADWFTQVRAEQPYDLASPVVGEFNRDAYEDLIGVDPATGKLWLYPGTATSGSWGPRVLVDTGATDWNRMTNLVVGRFNRDAVDDLIAVESSTGLQFLYPGTTAGVGWGARIQIGGNWQTMSKLVSGRFNRDGYDDVMAVEISTGKLWLYPGTAAGGGLGARVEAGRSGWNAMSKLASGQLNRGDAYDDLLALESSTGKLWLYPGTAAGTAPGTPVEAGRGGWNAMSGIVVGRFNADAYDDLLAVEAANGQSWLYPGIAEGVTWGTPVPPAGRRPAPQPYGLGQLVVGEFNRDTYQDLIGVETLTGRQFLYPGTATGLTWGNRIQIGTNWQSVTKLVSGRFNRDDYDDLLAVETSTGKLWLYPGTATGGALGTRVEAGRSGWNAMSKLASGEFNRDAYDDLLAVEQATGKLWLYPGTSAGTTWGTPVVAGTGGWTSMDELLVGRFNPDAYDDLLAVEQATGKLWLYPGTSTGTTWGTRVEVPGDTWASRSELLTGSFTRDGHDDLLLIDDATGKLLLFPGVASNVTRWAPAVEVGPGR